MVCIPKRPAKGNAQTDNPTSVSLFAGGATACRVPSFKPHSLTKRTVCTANIALVSCSHTLNNIDFEEEFTRVPFRGFKG